MALFMRLACTVHFDLASQIPELQSYIHMKSNGVNHDVDR